MLTKFALTLALSLLVPGAASAAGEDALPADLDEVRACLDSQAPPDSAYQEVRFLSRSKSGNEREILGSLTWKRFEDGRARVLARVSEPDDLRGSAVLLVGRKDGGSDLFSYLPELRKVRRIQTTAMQGNLFGSDFTYEDFQQLQGLALDGATEVDGAAEIDGVPVWKIVRVSPKESGSMYSHVVSYVERERCLLRKAEMWEPGDRLRKVLTPDLEQLFEHDGVRIPRSVVLEDRKRGSSTQLDLLEIDLDKKIRRRDLEVSALER